MVLSNPFTRTVMTLIDDENSWNGDFINGPQNPIFSRE